jgi:phosphate transport system protein
MIKEILAVFKSDTLMDKAHERSFNMLHLTREMFLKAKDVLRYSDHNHLDIDINDSDLEVNKYEREVRKDVLNHLILTSGEDLTSGLALVSIVIDIEQIGDRTKNISELTLNHPNRLNAGIFEEKVKKIEKGLEDCFDKVIDCFENDIEDVARKLLEESKWISKEIEEITSELIKDKNISLESGTTVALALYLRALKRIYSHLRNIATSVVNPYHRIGYKPKPKPEE